MDRCMAHGAWQSSCGLRAGVCKAAPFLCIIAQEATWQMTGICPRYIEYRATDGANCTATTARQYHSTR